MELMQGLVKMAWGARGGEETSSSRDASNPSGAGETPQSSGEGPGGARAASPRVGGSNALGRSDSVDSALWSEMDLNSEKGDPNDGHRSQLSASSTAENTSGKAGGARAIFSMPFTEQVGLRMCVHYNECG